jgi:hypothetical protein
MIAPTQSQYNRALVKHGLTEQGYPGRLTMADDIIRIESLLYQDLCQLALRSVVGFIQHALLYTHKLRAVSLSRERCASDRTRRNMDCSNFGHIPILDLTLITFLDQHRPAHTSPWGRHSQGR